MLHSGRRRIQCGLFSLYPTEIIRCALWVSAQHIYVRLSKLSLSEEERKRTQTMRALCTALLAVSTAAMLLGSSVAEATHIVPCPVDEMAAYSWTQEQYGAGFTNHSTTWYMSPCNLATPAGHNTPVYMALSSNSDTSRSDFNTIKLGWHKYRHEFYIEFSTAANSLVKVHVTCDANVALGAVEPNGAIKETSHPGISWTVPIRLQCKGACPLRPLLPSEFGPVQLDTAAVRWFG